MKPKSAEALADDFFNNKCDVHKDDVDLAFKNFLAGHASRDEEVRALREALKLAGLVPGDIGYAAREVLAKYPGEKA